jgi:hypothetical protein
VSLHRRGVELPPEAPDHALQLTELQFGVDVLVEASDRISAGGKDRRTGHDGWC